MLSSRDVGRRVVVRRVVDPAGPSFTDTIGQLVRADDAALVVRPDRGGSDVTIETGRVVAAKRVPPRRRRATVEELELIAARSWPAVHTEPLGDWLLRASGGWTSRANSALVVGEPGMPLPAALERVTSWYAERDLPARCQLPLPSAADTDRALAGLGWGASPLVLVHTAPIDRVRRVHRPAGLPPVRFSDRPSERLLDIFRGQERGLPPSGLAVLTGGDPTFVEVVGERGEVVAGARAAVREGHLGVFSLEVVPGHRRRGLARHVLAALAAAMFDRAHTVYLQVQETNEPALALYDRLGFHLHHSYRYRSPR